MAGTVIERKTFENSYQNSAARKSEIAAFEAQLAELDAMLADPALDDSTRRRLQGQRRALNIQLSRAREQLDSAYLK